MKLVCPRCGREVDFLVGRVCSMCFVELYGLARLQERVEAEICRYCGAVRLGGRWVQVYSFGGAVEALARYLVSKARPVEPLERVELARVEYDTLPNWRTRIQLKLNGVYRGHVVEGSQELTVRLKPSVCTLCKTRVSGEYDTVLQVRGADPELLEEKVGEVIERLGIHRQTVDLIPGRNGVDVYFTNTGAARKVARELSKLLGGAVTVPRYEEVGVDASGRRRGRKTLVLRVGRAGD